MLLGGLEFLDAFLDAGEAFGRAGVEAAGLLVEGGGFLDADVAGGDAVGQLLELGDQLLERRVPRGHAVVASCSTRAPMRPPVTSMLSASPPPTSSGRRTTVPS